MDRELENSGEKQCLIQDARLYDIRNNRIFSDKLRFVIVNFKMLDTKIAGIDKAYYENLLILLK